ncbi:amino acid ABC transporter substrate-binding protein [Marinomonas sp. PE14-40]|uniref:amino acid ABC transporter substrate-binding protein n=1 Tax=Marinomonas sp. PE14-40 TaxID=3060621 RepID=UPI003F67CA6A
MSKLILILSFVFLSSNSLAMQKVIYPSVENIHETRFHDLFEILEQALEITRPDFGDYELSPSPFPMTESRMLQEVKSGRMIDVIWSSTSPKKEEELRPIRIPLRKGILGYRISFIHKEHQAIFDQVKTLNDLKQFRVGQGIGWGDIEIYKHNNIPASQAPYVSLFSLIEPRRYNLFPRGVNEIYKEYEVYGKDNPTLVIEDGIVLYYPWPYYLFTSRQNEALALRLEEGLERMIENGSFEAIFNKYNADAIRKAELGKRRLITLENPFIPAETPLNRSELWFSPVELPNH